MSAVAARMQAAATKLAIYQPTHAALREAQSALHDGATVVKHLEAEIERLEKIEKAARWFAIAAMDRDAPPEVGPQMVADLLAAFGLDVKPTVPQ